MNAKQLFKKSCDKNQKHNFLKKVVTKTKNTTF